LLDDCRSARMVPFLGQFYKTAVEGARRRIIVLRRALSLVVPKAVCARRRGDRIRECDVCLGSSTASPIHRRRGCFTPDCVAKLFFRVCANFSRGAGAFARKLCRGSHERSDFQPAAFVSSLLGIVSPKIHFDGQIAKFPRALIFEFCNTIPHKAAAATVRHRGSYGPGRGSCAAANVPAWIGRIEPAAPADQ
jgi:hypothetical protein